MKMRTRAKRTDGTRNPLVYGALVLAAVIALGFVVAAFANQRGVSAEARPQMVFTAPPTEAPEAVKFTLPENPSVLIFGDSFSQGTGARNPETEGYAQLLPGLMGWTNVTYSPFGGTGLVSGTVGDSRPYPERIRLMAMDISIKPDLIILQGSINDRGFSAAVVENGTRYAVDNAHRAWPNAVVVITAPITYQDSSNATAGYSRGAAAAGAYYFPTDGWLPNDPALFSADGWHPSTEGHAYVAQQFATALQAALAP